MTEEAFHRLGDHIYNNDSFENRPYPQIIVVATNQRDWEALLTYAHKVFKLSPDIVAKFGDAYSKAAGYNVTFPVGTASISFVGLHGHRLTRDSPTSVIKFLDVLAHELQHSILKFEAWSTMHPVKEEEPHAYSTGFCTARILEIVQRKTSMLFMALPFKYGRVLDAVYSVPENFITQLSGLAARSALRDASMLENQSIAEVDENGWRAVTYTAGGLHHE